MTGEGLAVTILVSRGGIDGAMRIKTLVYVRGDGVAFNFSYIAVDGARFDEIGKMADYSFGTFNPADPDRREGE